MAGQPASCHCGTCERCQVNAFARAKQQAHACQARAYRARRGKLSASDYQWERIFERNHGAAARAYYESSKL